MEKHIRRFPAPAEDPALERALFLAEVETTWLTATVPQASATR